MKSPQPGSARGHPSQDDSPQPGSARGHPSQAKHPLAGRPELGRLCRGIEKESLRVTPSGALAATPHPAGLGSPLTHPHITTDFSEAQPELITSVHDSVAGCLSELTDIHRFVYRHLGDELLWAASMPCILADDAAIPVGRYGTSNVGRAKTIYRIGLGHRYGRLMQTISGIHYNFSLPPGLWPAVAAAKGETFDAAAPTRGYFALIRNFRRRAWLLAYLFGASPAVCKSFVRARPHTLETLDEGTLHLPHATSLRLGPLGYQSAAQSSLHVSYNSLDAYGATLHDALTRPYPPYEAIGMRGADGRYRQLGTALLQIENEFYGAIRPKRRAGPGERPVQALKARGVEYVEVRCLDLDPFEPVGIDADAMRFMDVFLLSCLLADSPPDSPEESVRLVANQLAVVERGRAPDLWLEGPQGPRRQTEWAGEILDECEAAAALIDAATGGDESARAVARQRAKVADPAATPSARVLAAMQAERTPFFHFAMRQSAQHKRHFDGQPLTQAACRRFERLSHESVAEQARVEAADAEPFETYLARQAPG